VTKSNMACVTGVGTGEQKGLKALERKVKEPKQAPYRRIKNSNKRVYADSAGDPWQMRYLYVDVQIDSSGNQWTGREQKSVRNAFKRG
jgi:hypothetical protein